MNILFLLRTLGTGGVTVVSSALANKFSTEGHKVYAFYFQDGSSSIANRFDERVELVKGYGYSVNKKNIKLLRRILIEKHIEVIINQWGLPLIPIHTALKASKKLDVKIISIYHNAPSFNGRIQTINIQLSKCKNPVKQIILKAKREVFKYVTSMAMRYIYKKSDMFFVLSESYKDEFSRFTGVKDIRKLDVMTNPVTIDTTGFVYHEGLKEKEIIYIGRLDFVQKRVHRIIETWNYIEEQFPDWHLTIVGDGEDRANLENYTLVLGLKHVTFEGFKPPIDYYKRSSILLLTSDFEGFPLVLAESMSFGVIPMVYHTFAAVDDIIEDGKDGIIIPYSPDGFKAEETSHKLSMLMKNNNQRNKMAIAAIKKSHNFSIDKIYQEWMIKLEQIN